jgi:hypothetical protein
MNIATMTETEKREAMKKVLTPEDLRNTIRFIADAENSSKDHARLQDASTSLGWHVAALELKLASTEAKLEEQTMLAGREKKSADQWRKIANDFEKDYSLTLLSEKELGMFAGFALQGMLANPSLRETSEGSMRDILVRSSFGYGQAMMAEMRRTLPKVGLDEQDKRD